MTLDFFEGFENMELAGRAGMSIVTDSGYPPIFIPGRLGGKAISSATGASFPVNGKVYGTINPDATNIYCLSAAVKYTGGDDAGLVIGFQDTGGTNNSFVTIANTSRILSVNGAGSGQASTYAIPLNQWVRMELRTYAHISAGWVELWVDGIKIAEKLNFQTLGFPGALMSRFVLNMAQYTSRWHFDDVYLTNGAGAAPYNGSLGDVRVETLLPNGNGAFSDFAGSDGNSVDNYQLVDEVPASATDYVTSAAAGNRDSYATEDLQGSGTVYAVQIHAQALKTDAGSAFIKPTMRRVTTDFIDSSQGLSTGASWVKSAIRTVGPTGIAWTVANVNASEFGFQASNT